MLQKKNTGRLNRFNFMTSVQLVSMKDGVPQLIQPSGQSASGSRPTSSLIEKAALKMTKDFMRQKQARSQRRLIPLSQDYAAAADSNDYATIQQKAAHPGQNGTITVGVGTPGRKMPTKHQLSSQWKVQQPNPSNIPVLVDIKDKYKRDSPASGSRRSQRSQLSQSQSKRQYSNTILPALV